MIPDFANNAWLKKQNAKLIENNDQQSDEIVSDSLFMKLVVIAITISPVVSLFVEWFVI